MPYGEHFILMGVGGFFLLLGLVVIIWGKTEEKKYYNSMTRRTDLREYLAHWPPRPEPGALKTGGWISLAIGVIMLITGVIFWLLG